MRNLWIIFLSSFFFSIHASLVSYVHSSMLREYLHPQGVSLVFAFGSMLSLVVVLCAPRIIKKTGVVRFLVLLLMTSALSLWLIGTHTSATLIIPIFILYFSLNTAIFYCIDLFIEHYSSNNKTGNIRGLAMTINNLGWVSVPIIAGIITQRYGFSSVYLLASLAMGTMLVLITITQRHFRDKYYPKVQIGDAYNLVRHSPPIRRIMSLNFLLQFFYAWMVLYTPLYLFEVHGFDWKTIGIILSIMLLPFVLFQYPAGRLADRIGEKRPIIISLIIAGITTALFGISNSHQVVTIAALLFGTRIGISMLEVLCDSYFFKHVSDKDTSIISLYRSMMPIAYMVGPLAGATLLFFFSYTTLFILLGILLCIGGVYAVRLVDTH